MPAVSREQETVAVVMNAEQGMDGMKVEEISGREVAEVVLRVKEVPAVVVSVAVAEEEIGEAVRVDRVVADPEDRVETGQVVQEEEEGVSRNK